ncbi:type II secretion system protein GspM [Lysobacter humi (ex Lee et al. 2017)]
MTPVVTDRERWIALGLLLLVLLLAYGVLVHPWWTVPMQETQARIERLRDREDRLRAQLAQRSQVTQRLAAAQAQLASRPGFLPEATAELATAGLVQRLETVVAQASPGYRSCAISNRSPLAERGSETYARVAVQVRLRCGTPELATVLHALEAGTPRLFVENLNILAQRFFFAGAGDSGSGRDTGLDVSFDLVGYLRPQPELAEGASLPTEPSQMPGLVPAPTAMPGAMPGPPPQPSSTAPPAAMPAPATGTIPAMSEPAPPAPVDAPGGPGAP